MNGLCDRDPNILSLSESLPASLARLALADHDGPLAIAATRKMMGAGVRGSKDL